MENLILNSTPKVNIRFFKNKINFFTKSKDDQFSKTKAIYLCKMENCKNVIQASSFSSSSSMSPYCDKCISKLEATKIQNEKNEAKKALLKPATIELPVTHVTSRSKNDISAYDRTMTSNSKLYNVGSLPTTRAASLKSNRDSSDNDLSGYNHNISNKYIPSVSNQYSNFPTYAATKEKCVYCTKVFFNTSRSTKKNNTGLCDSCFDRFGRNKAFD